MKVFVQFFVLKGTYYGILSVLRRSSAGQVGGGVIVLYTGRQYMKVMVQSKFVVDSHKDHAL
jgi:hypothetical protein